MRWRPTALGWVDSGISTAFEWDSAQVCRLCRRLGYGLIWDDSPILELTDRVRTLDVDAVVLPAPMHLDPLTINNLMHVADVEIVSPRLSFARWSAFGGV